MNLMFNELEIVNQLKTIIKSIEENEGRKNIILAYHLKTGLVPKECNCKKGIERLKCKECEGTGYILVEKHD